NILAPRIAGARVLDGYAGTGAAGIEALSRGAAAVTFVDRDRRAPELVGTNVAPRGVGDPRVFDRPPMARALTDLRPAGMSVVHAARAYAARPDAALHAVADVLAPGGVVVVEHARRQAMPDRAGPLARSRDVRSGDSVLTFYTRPPEAAPSDHASACRP